MGAFRRVSGSGAEGVVGPRPESTAAEEARAASPSSTINVDGSPVRTLDRFREGFPAVRDDKTGDRLLVLGRLHIVRADRHKEVKTARPVGLESKPFPSAPSPNGAGWGGFDGSRIRLLCRLQCMWGRSAHWSTAGLPDWSGVFGLAHGARGIRHQAPAQLNTCMYRDGTNPYRNPQGEYACRTWYCPHLLEDGRHNRTHVAVFSWVCRHFYRSTVRRIGVSFIQNRL